MSLALIKGLAALGFGLGYNKIYKKSQVIKADIAWIRQHPHEAEPNEDRFYMLKDKNVYLEARRNWEKYNVMRKYYAALIEEEIEKCSPDFNSHDWNIRLLSMQTEPKELKGELIKLWDKISHISSSILAVSSLADDILDKIKNIIYEIDHSNYTLSSLWELTDLMREFGKKVNPSFVDVCIPYQLPDDALSQIKNCPIKDKRFEWIFEKMNRDGVSLLFRIGEDYPNFLSKLKQPWMDKPEYLELQHNNPNYVPMLKRYVILTPTYLDEIHLDYKNFYKQI